MRDEHISIAELLEKYPDLNQEEREQFNQWLEQGNNKDFFNSIIDKEILEEELRQLDELKTESEQRKSWEKLLQFRMKPQRLNTIWLNNWKMYAAAASIITILGVGGLIWYQSQKGNKHVVQGLESQVPIVTDINPGRYEAKLTLADGSIVVLDSFSKSSLRQGSAAIHLIDGQLVYEQLQKGKNADVIYNTLSTANGETFGMVLSDGSKVWLNSQSSIRYPVLFDGHFRKVEVKGEAYFEVAPLSLKGKDRVPFIAYVNGIEVEVLGTQFNINSYEDEDAVRTTLLEGKVKVRSSSNGTEAILRPGEQANWYKRKQQLNKVDSIDVEEVVAWHRGYFQFNNAHLPVVMRQLARWYNVSVKYEGVIADENFEFWGKIPRSMTLSQVLSILQKQNVHFKIEGETIIVKP